MRPTLAIVNVHLAISWYALVVGTAPVPWTTYVEELREPFNSVSFSVTAILHPSRRRGRQGRVRKRMRGGGGGLTPLFVSGFIWEKGWYVVRTTLHITWCVREEQAVEDCFRGVVVFFAEIPRCIVLLVCLSYFLSLCFHNPPEGFFCGSLVSSDALVLSSTNENHMTRRSIVLQRLLSVFIKMPYIITAMWMNWRIFIAPFHTYKKL